MGCPVVLGLGVEENFVASDVAALLPVTRRFMFLDEGDVAEIQRNGTDRFTVNAFQKLKCHPQSGKSGYVCDFRVDLRLVNGPMERTLTDAEIEAACNKIVSAVTKATAAVLRG